MLLSNLRKQIVEGRLSPGSRLPTRNELERKYGVSTITTQRAFDTLKHDGFVESRGKLGTFVTANPPHLCHYGLAFFQHLGQENWRRFDTAFLNEASAIDKLHDRKMRFYYGIDYKSDLGGECRRLVADAHASRLAGVIFAARPSEQLLQTLATKAPQMPCVAITGSRPADLPTASAVTLGSHNLFAKAIDYLASLGRRRIAFLNSPNSSQVRLEEWEQNLRTFAANKGMTSEPHWMLAASTTRGGVGVPNLIHLLFEQSRANRPDCLFITNDNLVEHATAGLMAAGVRVPQDVDVVAHCNFPWPVPSSVPVKRVGYDAREVLRRCISIIDEQRGGRLAPRLVVMDAVFEEEVAAASEQHADS